MYSIPQILASAGINYEDYPAARGRGIFLTKGNQLVGTYANLKRYQGSSPHYLGWDSHHIVEDQDLARLGVQGRCPPYEQQVCVLLPKTAHAKRVNSVLRNQNPTNVSATVTDLKRAYRDAYSIIGDYCGGGEMVIRTELLAIVSAVFRSVGL